MRRVLLLKESLTLHGADAGATLPPRFSAIPSPLPLLVLLDLALI